MDEEEEDPHRDMDKTDEPFRDGRMRRGVKRRKTDERQPKNSHGVDATDDGEREREREIKQRVSVSI